MAIFDCATWRPVANHGGRMAAQQGLILHHAVATGSLYAWFNNPSSGVSAHFWVALDGRIEQYVDSELTAWHAMQLNDTYCGVETEGCAAPPHAQPMTDAMVAALSRLYAEGARRHGWPNALADADGQPGFGYHRMAVATSCPCDERLRQRPRILDLAFGQPPTLEEEDMPLNDDDKEWITKAINDALRQQFRPEGECYGRVYQADVAAIRATPANIPKT